MGKGKRQRPEKYRIQRIRTSANKARAWRRHLEAHPNDQQARVILKEKMRSA